MYFRYNIIELNKLITFIVRHIIPTVHLNISQSFFVNEKIKNSFISLNISQIILFHLFSILLFRKNIYFRYKN